MCHLIHKVWQPPLPFSLNVSTKSSLLQQKRQTVYPELSGNNEVFVFQLSGMRSCMNKNDFPAIDPHSRQYYALVCDLFFFCLTIFGISRSHEPCKTNETDICQTFQMSVWCLAGPMYAVQGRGPKIRVWKYANKPKQF